ncbi:MAG: hypothetical protein NTW19_09520, partial [Planctomycetota bacterium]|nr:hypothetical protein [Planctomycetota bacterium]
MPVVDRGPAGKNLSPRKTRTSVRRNPDNGAQVVDFDSRFLARVRIFPDAGTHLWRGKSPPKNALKGAAAATL